MSRPLQLFAWDSREAAWTAGPHAGNPAAATTLRPSVPARASLNLVIPYTEWALASATLARLAPIVHGLTAAVELIAVQPTPYPAPMGSAVPSFAFLVEQVAALADGCPLDLRPKVVLARYWNDGFRSALKAGALVVMGTRVRPWRTREERLARLLQSEGHEVTLWRMERRASAMRSTH